MFIESRSKTNPHAPAEVRAWCDGERAGKRCEEVGPPVECRTPRKKRDPDHAASALAMKVSGFFRVNVAQGRREWVELVFCRTCAGALLMKLQREHAAEIADLVSKRGVIFSRFYVNRERVELMDRLRTHLGIVVPGMEAACTAP